MAPFLGGVWMAGVCLLIGFAAGRDRNNDPSGDEVWLALLWPVALGVLVIASPFIAAAWLGYSVGKRGRPE